MADAGDSPAALFGYRIDSDQPLRRCRPTPTGRGTLRVRSTSHDIPCVGEIVAIDDVGAMTALALAGTNLLFVDRYTGEWQIDVTAGEIVARREGSVDAWEHRLAATIVPLLLGHRGDLALHAAALAGPDGRAIVVCGRPGAGKSTLAAAVTGRGYTVMSEDGAVITDEADGRSVVWPGSVGVRLGRASREALLGEAGGPWKRSALLDCQPVEPAHLGAVVLLAERTGDAPTVAMIEPPVAVSALVPFALFAGSLGLPDAMRACAVAAARVPVLTATLPDDLSRVGDHAEWLLDQAAAAGTGTVVPTG